MASRSVTPEDWGDGTPGPLNGRIGAELADVFVNLVREQSGVRSVCDLGCTSLLAASGFIVVKLRYYGRAPWLWKNMICVARKAE
ncbi:MAG: hypothetical protein AB7P34_14480 [Vicinamibacterales bacterium]